MSDEQAPAAETRSARGHRHAQTDRPGRGTATIVLLAVTVLIAAAGAVDLLAAPAPAPPPQPLQQEPPTAGTWYCPAVGGEGETVTVTVAAVGDMDSQVVVERYPQRRPVGDDPRTLAPGEQAVVELTEDDATAAVRVRWSGGPVATSWRVDGGRTAGAPCVSSPSERWYATGFNTTLGSRSRLHLFNPFTADAVVRLVFATPDGPVRLVLTDNLLVGAGRTRSVNLNRFQPEIPDLGVIVEVLTGRVVAQGELTVDPPGDTAGAAGRLLLSAAPEPSQTWATAYAASGDGTESWLSVLNPGEHDAAIEVRVSAPSDEDSSIVGEVSIPAGGVTRVELANTSVNPEFGVMVTVVNDVPVVVSRMTTLRARGRRTATGGLAAHTLATTWSVLGGGAGERTGTVNIYNASGEEATVDIVAPGAPPEWSGITVAPNGRARVELSEADPEAAALPVMVRSDVDVVAELRSTTAGERVRLWLGLGIPAQTWLGPTTRPPVALDPSLSTRPIPPRREADESPQELDDLGVEPDAGDPEADATED